MVVLHSRPPSGDVLSRDIHPASSVIHRPQASVPALRAFPLNDSC
jgi:hypothetical protein